MKELRVVKVLESIELADDLDPAIERITSVTNAVLKPRGLRDLLHGVPAGHPLHPALVLVPMGAWIGAAVLDLMPGNNKAARTLVGVGMLGVTPSVLAGLVDWTEAHEQQKRVGLVHAGSTTLAAALYGLSYLQRRRDRQLSAKVLGFAGLAAVSLGGFIGGHLAYHQALGANHVEQVPHLVTPGWQDLLAVDDLPTGELTAAEVDGVPVVVWSRPDGYDVLAAECSHLSGPLADGEVTVVKGDACVSCPWHDSLFSLATGEVTHGPATSPQPRFDTRVVEGRLQVKLPHAG